MDKISIILANYNHGKYIEEAVASILAQTYENFELILIDDHSSDESKEILTRLQTLDSRIRKPIFLEQNRGKWNALNVAISSSTGKLITLQDADDASCQDRLERQVRCLKEHKSLHSLCGFRHCWTDTELSLHAKQRFTGGLNTMNHETVLKHVFDGYKHPQIKQYWVGGQTEAHGATSLFYRQLWENGMRFNPPNTGLRITWSEDSDFNIRMTLLLQKTSFLDEPLYCYRRNTGTHGTGESAIDQCF